MVTNNSLLITTYKEDCSCRQMLEVGFTGLLPQLSWGLFWKTFWQDLSDQQQPRHCESLSHTLYISLLQNISWVTIANIYRQKRFSPYWIRVVMLSHLLVASAGWWRWLQLCFQQCHHANFGPAVPRCTAARSSELEVLTPNRPAYDLRSEVQLTCKPGSALTSLYNSSANATCVRRKREADQLVTWEPPLPRCSVSL